MDGFYFKWAEEAFCTGVDVPTITLLAHADMLTLSWLSLITFESSTGYHITMNDDTLRLPSPEQRHGQHIAYDDGLVKAMVQWVDNFLNTRWSVESDELSRHLFLNFKNYLLLNHVGNLNDQDFNIIQKIYRLLLTFRLGEGLP